MAPSGYYEKALKAIKDFVGFQSPRTYTPVGSTHTPVGSGLQQLDLAGRHVTRLTGHRTVEELLPKESKIYTNRSKTATLTKEIGIIHSTTRTVTMEERKLKAYTAEAGVAPVGFGAIRAQVQQQSGPGLFRSDAEQPNHQREDYYHDSASFYYRPCN